jgi:AraC-like DNA-binding protein
MPSPAPVSPSPAQVVLGKTMGILEAEYASELTSTDIAGRLYMSERNFQRSLKSAGGKTFTDLLNRVRMEHASAMIGSTDESISEISLKVGFQTYTHFRRVFKALFGVSPSEYRDRNHGSRQIGQS